MRDILGSAILFDMYYGGKSVAEGEGGKTVATKTYALPMLLPLSLEIFM
jgi:hypothetical protein